MINKDIIVFRKYWYSEKYKYNVEMIRYFVLLFFCELNVNI